MTTTRSAAREAVGLEAQIGEIESAIASLLAHLKPGSHPQQRASLERMIAKKQATLRRLQNKHLGFVRASTDDDLVDARERRERRAIPGPRTQSATVAGRIRQART